MPDDGALTRVDVLFKNVTFVHLPSDLVIESIEETFDADAEDALAVAGISSLAAGQKVYRLGAGGAFVVAGVVVSVEDRLSHHDPSGLPCWPMRSGQG